MDPKTRRQDLLNKILDEKTIPEEDEDELIHILLEERLSKDFSKEHKYGLTRGQKAADTLANFAGSWTFIFIFFGILVVWIGGNVYLLQHPFDVYPFILLNLILSCLAAIQAPVIMMSQNRQEEKDRLRAKNDYKVNLKSEIIIEDLHYKLEEISQRLDELSKK
ncbi:MAG: DUF1003 domain-containing protein [Firmicutes bacterium]|nr:DUF1003 domain-containing protein [Bacillota bacterium]